MIKMQDLKIKYNF